jgi:hypothetical protein
MQVAKAPQEGEKVKDDDVLINCTFTMVSLDPVTKKYDMYSSCCYKLLKTTQAGKREPVDCRDIRRKALVRARRTQLQDS